MKIKFILLALLFTTISNAQVGIGNDAPKVTLDISGNPDLTSSVDGLLIPRVTGDELRAKNSIYTNVQHSTLVFVTESDSNPSGKTIKITEPGYYYYSQPESTSDGVWVRLTNDNHWKVQNTSNSASANTDNIYQKGKVAIGFDSATPLSLYNLEVKGQSKISNVESFTNNPNPLLSPQLYYGTISGGITTKHNNGAYSKGNMLYVSDVNIDENTNIAALFNNTSMIKTEYLRLGNSELLGTGILSIKKIDNKQIYSGLSSGINVSNDQFEVTNINQNQYDDFSNNITQHINKDYLDNHNGYTYGINLTSGKGSLTSNSVGTLSSINLFHNNGVTFINKESGNSAKSYTFPRNNGSANQILVTDGNSVNAKLSWKNISDLAQNNWKIQNTTNSATANTDNIYQKGKVAIGFDSSTSISEADLEVKGIFYTSDIKASGPSTQFLMGSGIGNMIVSEFENTQSGKYSSLNLNKEQLMLANSDGNKTSQLVLDRTVSNGNSYSQARLVSAQGEEVNAIDVTAGEIGTANSFAGGIKIHTKTTLKDRGIYIQPDHGIRFTNNKDFIGGGSYEFPTGNGSANQILVTDGNSVNAKLSWKNISDITSPTSPRYFYFPTLSLPITNSVNSRAGVTYNQADGTYQVDLFEILRNQMANPVASSNASSDYLSELVLQRDKYEYFVIEANQQVFKNISFLRGNGNEGKLVYKVNPVDNTSNSETMNIIIKQKQ